MAILVANADALWTGAATWATTDTGGPLRAQSNNTVLTTSYVESQTFTPGAITIDAILVMIATRAASPTGTMSVRLAQAGVTVVGTEVTVNVSDVPTCTTASTATTTPDKNGEGGWFLLKFAAPVLLIAATLYTVSAKTSSATQVNLYRDGTAGNWSRLLRTTTAASVGAGDDVIITKEWTAAATGTARTVTMDSTAATDYGSATTSQITPAVAITQGGTLKYQNTAATAYILRLSGYLIVYNGGTFNIGITGGSEIPRDSSAVLEFDCGADGDFGVVQRIGSVATTQGLSRSSGKNITWTKVNANMAAAATSATIVDDTGWLSGDSVVFSPTSQTFSDSDIVTLNANAGASSLAWTGGTTFAHLGTTPLRGEAILMTRNVQVRSVSTTNVTFWYVGGSATLDADWTSFRYFSSNATGKRGMNCDLDTGGNVTLDYCALQNLEHAGVYIINNAGTLTVNQCTGYTGSGDAFLKSDATATAVVTWTNNCFTNNTNSGIVSWNGSSTVGTMTGNCFSGAQGLCIFISGFPILTQALWSNNEIHSNRRSIECTMGGDGVLHSMTIWHTSSTTNAGIILSDISTFTFDSCKFYGNAQCNIAFTMSNQRAGTLTLLSCEGYGTTSFATTSNLALFNNTIVIGRIDMMGCTWSVASGVLTACTNDILINSLLQFCPIYADNCFFSGTNPITFNAATGRNVFLKSQRHGQVDDTHKIYYNHGQIVSNSTTFHGVAPSVELKPTAATSTLKLKSGQILVRCNDGQQKTIHLWIRKSAAYNGNPARLILARHDSMGVTADAVADTLSVAADTWEELTYLTPVAIENGVFVFYVDCDGTAGSIFYDDITAV